MKLKLENRDHQQNQKLGFLEGTKLKNNLNRLTKNKMRKIQITKIRNESGEPITYRKQVNIRTILSSSMLTS